MAKIGLNNFRYAFATEASDGTMTYAGAKKPGKAISFNFTPTKSDASLYADDTLAESDNQVTGGTCTMGLDRYDDATAADLLGHEVVDDEIRSNVNDVAPYVGLGRVTKMMIDNQLKHRATILKKVKFSEPNQEGQTKGASVDFQTYTFDGVVAVPADGEWRKEKTFDTEFEAVNYLEGYLGTGEELTVTYNVNGGSGTIPSATILKGQSVQLPDGAGLTPPTGKKFKGWATTDSATTPDVTSPYKPTADIELYVVWIDE